MNSPEGSTPDDASKSEFTQPIIEGMLLDVEADERAAREAADRAESLKLMRAANEARDARAKESTSKKDEARPTPYEELGGGLGGTDPETTAQIRRALNPDSITVPEMTEAEKIEAARAANAGKAAALESLGYSPIMGPAGEVTMTPELKRQLAENAERRATEEFYRNLATDQRIEATDKSSDTDENLPIKPEPGEVEHLIQTPEQARVVAERLRQGENPTDINRSL